VVAKQMPDGPLCDACYATARRRRGACPSCAQVRLLVGVDWDGIPVCPPCAGIMEDYTCSRCGTEWALRHGICEWCWLADDLDRLLPGPVDFAPLRRRLLGAARPDSIIIWLYSPTVRELLRGLSVKSIALDHDALDRFTPRRTADHVRGLLMAENMLPARNEQLARFDRLVAEHVDNIAATDSHREILRQFARWSLRPSLETKAGTAPLRDAQVNNATQKLRVATAFLDWLENRHTNMAELHNSDVDDWLASRPTTAGHVVSFLRWALKTGRCPKTVSLPKEKRGNGRVIDHDERLDLLRRLLEPATGALLHRVAGVLLVLFGQPYARIAELRVDDLIVDDTGQVGIRLGRDITPIPAPFDKMFTQLIENRPNQNTAANPDSPWLFPGLHAGSHMNPSYLRTAGLKMGIDLTPAKRGALRQLVLDCPPPVIADMLGYSYQTLDRHAQAASSPYRSYAAQRAVHGTVAEGQ
jgi:hypothetical protein